MGGGLQHEALRRLQPGPSGHFEDTEDQQPLEDVEVQQLLQMDSFLSSTLEVNQLCFQQGDLLSRSMLEALTCGTAESSQLRKLLLVPEEQRPVLQAYAEAMCGGTGAQRSERFRSLSEELQEQTSSQAATEKVGED